MRLLVRLLTLLDYGNEVEDLRILGRVQEGVGVVAIARGMNMSVQAAQGHIERLIKLGMCENVDRQIVLTAAGRRWVSDIENEMASVVRNLVSEERLQWTLARDTVERRLETRRLLHKLGKGEELTIVEAIKLEDAGLAKRRKDGEGPYLEMSDKGEMLLSTGRPGPRPGNGNRRAPIVVNKKS